VRVLVWVLVRHLVRTFSSTLSLGFSCGFSSSFSFGFSAGFSSDAREVGADVVPVECASRVIQALELLLMLVCEIILK